jgi:hypothetical protein
MPHAAKSLRLRRPLAKGAKCLRADRNAQSATVRELVDELPDLVDAVPVVPYANELPSASSTVCVGGGPGRAPSSGRGPFNAGGRRDLVRGGRRDRAAWRRGRGAGKDMRRTTHAGERVAGHVQPMQQPDSNGKLPYIACAP